MHCIKKMTNWFKATFDLSLFKDRKYEPMLSKCGLIYIALFINTHEGA